MSSSGTEASDSSTASSPVSRRDPAAAVERLMGTPDALGSCSRSHGRIALTRPGNGSEPLMRKACVDRPVALQASIGAGLRPSFHSTPGPSAHRPRRPASSRRPVRSARPGRSPRGPARAPRRASRRPRQTCSMSCSAKPGGASTVVRRRATRSSRPSSSKATVLIMEVPTSMQAAIMLASFRGAPSVSVRVADRAAGPGARSAARPRAPARGPLRGVAGGRSGVDRPRGSWQVLDAGIGGEREWIRSGRSSPDVRFRRDGSHARPRRAQTDDRPLPPWRRPLTAASTGSSSYRRCWSPTPDESHSTGEVILWLLVTTFVFASPTRGPTRSPLRRHRLGCGAWSERSITSGRSSRPPFTSCVIVALSSLDASGSGRRDLGGRHPQRRSAVRVGCRAAPY